MKEPGEGVSFAKKLFSESTKMLFSIKSSIL